MTEMNPFPEPMTFRTPEELQAFVVGLVKHVIDQHDPEAQKRINAAIDEMNRRKETGFKSDRLPDGREVHSVMIPEIDPLRFPNPIVFETFALDEPDVPGYL